MSKHVKYTGPSGAGVEVLVPLPDGQTRGVVVLPGESVPDEIDGQKVPAEFTNSLLEQDCWTASNQASTKKED
jgi:hypothetical protein